jgi:hypothetical protein
MTGYRRGFGDTILKYKNRSYEGASWKEVEISQLAKAIPESNFVIGWEDDDYWVGTSAGIFRYKNGTWTNPSREGTYRRPQYHRAAWLLDRNSLLFEGDWGSASLLSENGVTKLDGSARKAFYTDHGLLYMTDGDESSNGRHVKVSFNNPKTLGDKSTKYHEILRDDKEFFIHKDNNTVGNGSILNIRHIVQIAPGKCIGTVQTGKWCLVEFRNGIWYEIEDLQLQNIWTQSSGIWIDCSGTIPKNVVIVGTHGRVYVHQIGGSTSKMDVPPPQQETSMCLILVWGNSIDKLWTMDDNGTVWEKNGNDWRVVVRKLRENIWIKDAWVSPTGTVFAISGSKLYQLK